MIDLKQLTLKELRQFLSENRADDDKFSAALGELLSRESEADCYPANMSVEEVQRVLDQKLDQVNRSQQGA